ncbi:hypothetical protein [Pseudodesulfovibrio pelocollis]|nr:hypothetical protein [Pseudodesulfovibrio sp. SB368]
MSKATETRRDPLRGVPKILRMDNSSTGRSCLLDRLVRILTATTKGRA